MSSAFKYALSEINYLAGFTKNKVLLTYSAWLLSLIYLQVNSYNPAFKLDFWKLHCKTYS